MRKRMLFLATLITLIFGVMGVANALVYEYYQGYQSTSEGESFNFYFDLLSTNQGTTDSSLILVNDVAVGTNAIPFDSAFVQIELYSSDLDVESVLIELSAYYDNQTYELYNGTFNGYWDGETHFTFTYDISDTPFINGPYGDISILATVTGSDNDFGIKEVGIGGQPAPVPEPATLLLLATGLVGMAGIQRKRLKAN